jgi:PAS domain S-box-containing protein
MHKITARTMLKDEDVAEAQREDIRHLYWELSGYLVAIIASAIVLVSLLFKEFSKVKGLLRIAHAAEATASAARAQLTAVIDAVPARIAARDSNGGYIFRNKYSVDWIHGVGPDGEVTSSAEDELDGSAFDTGEVIPLFEQEEIDQQHGIHTWLTTKVPLEEEADRIAGVVTVSLDITQQKEAQKLNTLLATAVEHAGDVIEITDAESRFEYVNSAFERISGYSRDDALGKMPFSLPMSDPDDEPHYRAVQSAIASGQVWHGTLTGRRKDGTLYEQEATIGRARSETVAQAASPRWQAGRPGGATPWRRMRRAGAEPPPPPPSPSAIARCALRTTVGSVALCSLSRFKSDGLDASAAWTRAASPAPPQMTTGRPWRDASLTSSVPSKTNSHIKIFDHRWRQLVESLNIKF